MEAKRLKVLIEALLPDSEKGVAGASSGSVID